MLPGNPVVIGKAIDQAIDPFEQEKVAAPSGATCSGGMSKGTGISSLTRRSASATVSQA